MTRGFTLLEVVVAMPLLAVAVLAAVGTLAAASRMLADAEHLERAVLESQGILDSLSGLPAPMAGSRAFTGGELVWTVDSTRVVTLVATSLAGDTLIEVTSAVRAP